MGTKVFKYLESDSPLHNLRDYKGRKLSVKELAHMCGVEEVVIYANLKDPESPKDKIEEFLTWRLFNHPKGSKDLRVAIEEKRSMEELEKELLIAKVKKEGALAEKRTSEANLKHLDEEKKSLEVERAAHYTNMAKEELEKKKMENLIQSKEYVNFIKLQEALDDGLSRMRIALETLPKKFSSRWASMGDQNEIKREFMRELNTILKEFSNMEIVIE